MFKKLFLGASALAGVGTAAYWWFSNGKKKNSDEDTNDQKTSQRDSVIDLLEDKFVPSNGNSSHVKDDKKTSQSKPIVGSPEDKSQQNRRSTKKKDGSWYSSSDRAIVKHFYVGKRRIPVLFDTGATPSIMRERTFLNIEPDQVQDYKKENGYFKTVSGDSLVYSGRAKITLECQGKKIFAQVYIVRDFCCPLILGYQDIVFNGLVFDCENGHIQFQKEPTFKSVNQDHGDIIQSQIEPIMHNCYVGNSRIPVKLDTGAGVSVIRENVFRQIRTDLVQDFIQEDGYHTAVTDYPLKYSGKANIPLEIKGKKMLVPVYICPYLKHPIYLGYPEMRSNKMILDCAKGQITFNQ